MTSVAERGEKRMIELNRMPTEQPNPESAQIDRMTVPEMIGLMNREDRKVADAVEKEKDHIAEAVEKIYGQLRLGGRLIYCGAGTSGRLGILDAAALTVYQQRDRAHFRHAVENALVLHRLRRIHLLRRQVRSHDCWQIRAAARVDDCKNLLRRVPGIPLNAEIVNDEQFVCTQSVKQALTVFAVLQQIQEARKACYRRWYAFFQQLICDAAGEKALARADGTAKQDADIFRRYLLPLIDILPANFRDFRICTVIIGKGDFSI